MLFLRITKSSILMKTKISNHIKRQIRLDTHNFWDTVSMPCLADYENFWLSRLGHFCSRLARKWSLSFVLLCCKKSVDKSLSEKLISISLQKQTKDMNYEKIEHPRSDCRPIAYANQVVTVMKMGSTNKIGREWMGKAKNDQKNTKKSKYKPHSQLIGLKWINIA